MNTLLSTYCGTTRVGDDGRKYEIHTQSVIVEDGIVQRFADAAQAFLGAESTRLGIVVDDNTLAAAGKDVLASVQAAGYDVELLHLRPDQGKHQIVCDDATVEFVRAKLADANVQIVVPVGSGTISDLGKMSAHRLDLPCVSVGTAPSNNGYTSAIAAILSNGVKTTQPCTPALAVYADPVVMAAAPYRMIASGIGDLYSKPVSNADWRIAHRLTGSFYSPIVMELVEAGETLLEGVADNLASLDLKAVSGLTGAIMMSGLAMQAAGSSGPASGGEHLISHYLDMTATADNEPHDLHGCQVAVGTLVTSELYARLQSFDPADIDVAARVASLPDWGDFRARLESRFGGLSGAVLTHAKAAFPDAETLETRLTLLREQWSEIVPWACETLRPPADLRSELVTANCPVRFSEIGVSRARAVRAVLHSKDIRNRYTILHLLWELGVLDTWGDEIANAAF